MRIMNIFLNIATAMLLMSCGGTEDTPTGGGSDKPDTPVVPVTPTVEEVTSDISLLLSTDKCAYLPGEEVKFSVKGAVPSDARVRYRQGFDVIADAALSDRSWTWKTPAKDFTGYMAEIYQNVGEKKVKVLGTIAVDVSSDWTMFPRYGFVATFSSDKTDAVVESEMEWLNRCHINGVQFQDWHLSHHWPCPIDKDGNLMTEFKDIANRTNCTSVIKRYIDVQHSLGMKSIFYNLAFGVLKDAYDDGVKEEWNLYKQPNRNERDKHPLPDSWKSDIYLVNPANAEWQQYIGDRNEEVYQNFDFDGYQIDQLGYRGTLYDYDGNQVVLPQGYTSFINAMKERHPDKRLIMNAVSSYGTKEIASTGKVDFCYNEVWDSEKRYVDLYNIIRENDRNSEGGRALKTVFAAYMDYNRDRCDFNIPGILLTDAVMMSLGGQHLELGDHMLCREYFPYTGVRMSGDLKTAIEHYYDFQVAFQNLLRGGGKEVSMKVSSSQAVINQWPPVAHSVSSFAREYGNMNVVHLINFTNSNAESWRDADGKEQAPLLRSKLPITVESTKKVKRVWCASPDEHGGSVLELVFTQDGSSVAFTLPTLKYWTMIVLEY